MTATVAERETRRPTCLPSWPIGLLTGPEKSGKTFHAALASASELVGRTLWLPIGEDDPDEYGAIPGADFEIVPNDGTYRDFLAACEWASAQPRKNPDLPNLLVLDSASRLWDLICDDLQHEANARERRKAAKAKRAPESGDMQITVDLWNLGKQRWAHIIDTLRDHDGPSLVTARLDIVTVMENGQPTSRKDTKIKAEKSLPFDVGFIVEIPEPRKAILTGVRSLRVRATGTNREHFADFTVDALWRKLGLAEAVGVRTHSTAGHAEPTVDELAARISRATIDECRVLWNVAKEHGLLDQLHDDETPVGQLIAARVASLRVVEEAEREAQAAAEGEGR